MLEKFAVRVGKEIEKPGPTLILVYQDPETEQENGDLNTWPILDIYKKDEEFIKDHPNCPIIAGWITVSKKQFNELRKRMKECSA